MHAVAFGGPLGLSDEQLAQRYHDDQLLELLVTAGWYRLISYVLNAARVQPEPWAARFPTP